MGSGHQSHAKAGQAVSRSRGNMWRNLFNTIELRVDMSVDVFAQAEVDMPVDGEGYEVLRLAVRHSAAGLPIIGFG